MAKQTINLGTSANDRTGTNLRAALDICNDNFSELYNNLQYKYTNSVLSNPPTIAEINAITGVTEITSTPGQVFIIADNNATCYLVMYAIDEVHIWASTKLIV